MASILTQSAFKRVEGGGGKAAARAKKLADLYIKKNTTGNKVDSPEVYQYVIANFLDPYADDLGIQQKIADYTNKAETLASNKQIIAGSLAALKLKEQGAWYTDEDDVSGGSTFRNPLSVARITSENLDRLVMETVMASEEQRRASKDSSEIDNYLIDLNRKADRMRSALASVENGQTGELGGFGYFLDTDPNDGTIRGATFAPTDMKIDGTTDKTKTDSTVNISNASVPIHINTLNIDGKNISYFGGKKYSGNNEKVKGGKGSILLSDTEQYKFSGLGIGGGASFEKGKLYTAFTGETYQNGDPKSKFFWHGYDDKTYSFNDDDPEGKAFVESLKSTGGVNTDHLPRINPLTATRVMANPLSSNPGMSERAVKIAGFNKEQVGYNAEKKRYEDKNLIEKTQDGFTDILANTFFGAKNKPNKPDVAPARTAPDVVDSAQRFFRMN